SKNISGALLANLSDYLMPAHEISSLDCHRSFYNDHDIVRTGLISNTTHIITELNEVDNKMNRFYQPFR
ncbi:MAG: hypothetical protein ACKO5E_18665, partial [bacterium]